MRLGNYTPGFVAAYDPATRLCRVRIPGVTDGADVLPQAMLSYPIGDKSEHTELRILAGDRVWLDFVNGDPRYPIITGFRPKETDNAVDWRRWHHANIELTADTDLRMTATAGEITITAGTKVTLIAPQIKLDGNTTCTGAMQVQGLMTYLAGLNGTGTAAITGSLTNNGVNVGSTHTHAFLDDNRTGNEIPDVTNPPS